MSLEGLEGAVGAGEVDTVVVAVPDLQGRLQGKRYHARFFLDEVAGGALEACAYVLATDVDMSPSGGFTMSSWDNGFPDLRVRPDLSTLRLLPWYERTALCLGDAEDHHGAPLAVAPRQVLRDQLRRLAGMGLLAEAATELEFIVFAEDAAAARAKGYAGLSPVVPFNADYSILATGGVEPLIADIRRSMVGAGMVVESSKGECAPGQQEVAIRHADPLTTADQHCVFKLGVREVAARHGLSATFMAKYAEAEGSSCHVHLSLWEAGGVPAFCGEDGADTAALGRFIAGLRAFLPELTLLMAPNVNSYKRFAPGTFAPVNTAWDYDNRTCALRVVGAGRGRRVENRVPGADVNPYLALAATLAAGCEGIEQDLDPGPPAGGNAYEAPAGAHPPLPRSLEDAVTRLDASSLARRVLGDEVVDHYVRAGEFEVRAFGAAVTDWERRRGFERL